MHRNLFYTTKRVSKVFTVTLQKKSKNKNAHLEMASKIKASNYLTASHLVQSYIFSVEFFSASIVRPSFKLMDFFQMHEHWSVYIGDATIPKRPPKTVLGILL